MRDKSWTLSRKQTRAIHARIALIGNERGISRSEIKKAMQSEKGMTAFTQRQKISFDWLLLGDLRGLLRTIQWAKQS